MKNELEILTKKYIELSKNYFDLDRLNHYLISHHSTAIEGSTLTILETEIFLEKGLTAQNKPLEHHLMVKDHFEALNYVIKCAFEKQKIDIKFIQSINAHIMKNTGGEINTALGTFDSSKGDLRLLSVKAGATGASYMSFDKVPIYLKKLCGELSEKINTVKSVNEINELAYFAHYQLATIHPFVDGNGRTARLLMNYIQAYHKLPLTIVFENTRLEYIESLVRTREAEDIGIFFHFMQTNHLEYLKTEIQKLSPNQSIKTANIKGMGLVF
jgi:Fic family protein